MAWCCSAWLTPGVWTPGTWPIAGPNGPDSPPEVKGLWAKGLLGPVPARLRLARVGDEGLHEVLLVHGDGVHDLLQSLQHARELDRLHRLLGRDLLDDGAGLRRRLRPRRVQRWKRLRRVCCGKACCG